MGTLHEEALPQWHRGEEEIHRLLNVPLSDKNPTARGLPGPYAYRVAASPLVAVGALDDGGWPWTTVWGGEAQFARPIAPSVLGMQSLVDVEHDPVVDALFGAKKDGELIRPLREGEDGARTAKPMAALSIDLETRDRVKLAGTMAAGAVARQQGGVGQAQLAMLVQESLGNCPKYLNKKAIRPHVPRPRLETDALPLPQAAVDLVHKADLFFLSSTDGRTMDTNHRGGAPGFVRVASNAAADGGTVLVYPEFSGNRLYQTLGNLQVRPRVGIAVPDFDTGDVLYLTGTTTTLIGAAAAAVLPHTKLAVRIAVTAARFVRDGLPFRGDGIDHSPYNPPVRRLASELLQYAEQEDGGRATTTATLVDREFIAPTIARLTFRLQHPPGERKSPLRVWRPGQYVTLDFGPELDVGWSHMRDDDPQSLNDDFVRTFTISSVPPPAATGDGGEAPPDGTEFTITARKHGPATALLWRHRLPLELPVLGFGGEDGFQIPVAETAVAVFVAAGVGITPLLAQAPALLSSGVGRRLKVLWSLRAEDLPLAVDSLSRIDGLGARVRLFVTGAPGDAERKLLERVEGMGADVAVGRRMQKDDVIGSTENGAAKFYLCTGPELQKILMAWLKGADVVWESFAY